MTLPRPRTPRHAVILLLIAALLLASGLLASRRENFAAIPLLAAGACVAVWGCRTPESQMGDTPLDPVRKRR